MPHHRRQQYSQSTLCTICWEWVRPHRNCAITACGHTFHLHCLNQAMQMRNQCPVCRANIANAVPLAAARAAPRPQQRSFWDYMVEIFCFVPFIMTFLGLFVFVQVVAPYLDWFTWLEWFANAVFWPHHNMDVVDASYAAATQWEEQPSDMMMIPPILSAANASTFCFRYYDTWMRRNYV